MRKNDKGGESSPLNTLLGFYPVDAGRLLNIYLICEFYLFDEILSHNGALDIVSYSLDDMTTPSRMSKRRDKVSLFPHSMKKRNTGWIHTHLKRNSPIRKSVRGFSDNRSRNASWRFQPYEP